MDDPQPSTHSTPDYDERGWRPAPGTNPIPEHDNWDDRHYRPLPPGERETRTAELLRKLRKNALGISFGIVMVASLLAKYHLPYHQPILIISTGQFLLVGLVEFIIWLCGRVAFFSRLQKRTAELLATIFFGCTVASIACATIPGEPYMTVVYVAGAMTWSFGGSFWAWQRLSRLKETNARTRLGFLIKGWMMIPGFFAIVCFAGSLIALVSYCYTIIREKNDFPPGIGGTIFLVTVLSGLLSLLVLPAYKVERHVYRGR